MWCTFIHILQMDNTIYVMTMVSFSIDNNNLYTSRWPLIPFSLALYIDASPGRWKHCVYQSTSTWWNNSTTIPRYHFRVITFLIQITRNTMVASVCYYFQLKRLCEFSTRPDHYCKINITHQCSLDDVLTEQLSKNDSF